MVDDWGTSDASTKRRDADDDDDDDDDDDEVVETRATPEVAAARAETARLKRMVG